MTTTKPETNKLKALIQQKRQALREALAETAANEKDIERKRIAILIFAILLLAASLACYFTIGKQLLLFIEDKDAFKAWLAGFGAGSRIIFVLIRALQTVVKFIPAEPLEIGAGYVFGTWGGLLYCSLGSLLGSLIILLLTKKFGIKLVSLFVSKKKIDSLQFLQNKQNLNMTLFIIYLIPSTPKDIITYLIGLTDESIPLFLLITTIGRIPSIITSTWCGHTLQQENYLAAAAIFIATALFGFLCAFLYRRFAGRENRKMNEEISDNSGV